MNERFETVAAHYGDDTIGARILAALREEGIDITEGNLHPGG